MHEVLIALQTMFPACVTLVITIIILTLFTGSVQFSTVHTVNAAGGPSCCIDGLN